MAPSITPRSAISPPLLIQAGECTELPLPRGLLAGISPQANYRSESVQLNRGDLLLAYTDGLSEAEDHEGRAFGIDPCRDAAPLSRQRSALDARSALRPSRRRSAVRSRRAPG